jgi:hypothetical protein
MKALLLLSIGFLAAGGLFFQSKQSPTPMPQVVSLVPVGSKLPFAESMVAGKYYFGDGLGVNCRLEVTNDHRFAFRWTGCLGEYDRNEGSWEILGDTLLLKTEKQNKHEGFEGVNTRFAPIIWNQRLYLVDEYEAPGFCSTLESERSVGGVRDELHGQHYVLHDDNFKVVLVKLANYVPERFKSFVGKKPIQCKVIELNKDGTVTLDKGSADGLRPALMLGPDFWYTGDLEVLSVTPNRAIAKPGYFFNSVHLIEKGDLYDTGGKWYQPHGTGWQRLDKPPKIASRDKKGQPKGSPD